MSLIARIGELTVQVRALERDLRPLVRRHAPALLALPGVGVINAARLLAEVADVRRFSTEAKLALYAGVAPLDASSGRQIRHRLNPRGNRQLNSALRMIALTKPRIPRRRDYIARRRAEGKTGKRSHHTLRNATPSSAPSTDYSNEQAARSNSPRQVSSAPNAPASHRSDRGGATCISVAMPSSLRVR